MKMPFSNPLTAARRRPIRSVVLVLLLSLFVFGGGWAWLHFYVEHHRAAAEQAEARYDFDAAEQHLTNCLWARPRSAALHLHMARVARRGNHYAQAEEHLRVCQQLEGKNPDNALEAVLLGAQTGQVAEVEHLLQQQVDDGSADANLILEAMALGYMQTYRLDGAMYCLNRLLEREPGNVIALMARATLWKTAGNNPQSEEDYRRAVEAQPEHREARRQYGDLLLLTKQHEEALRQFEYLRQRPGGDSPEVLVGLARSHRQLGHTETARQVLEELLARQPHEGFALIERGKLALESESPAAAEKWLRQAVADYPFDAQANYLLAQSLQRQGKDSEARDYETARKRIDADLQALEAAFRRVVKNPRDPEPRLEAGLICQRNGRADECERWLLSALEQEPKHAATRAALAEHYEHTGKPELAADYRGP
jgi:tetratricopeptide (TPR) repeat protein